MTNELVLGAVLVAVAVAAVIIGGRILAAVASVALLLALAAVGWILLTSPAVQAALPDVDVAGPARDLWAWTRGAVDGLVAAQ